MIVIALLLQAATPNPNLVCGPASPAQGSGESRLQVAGMPDKQPEKPVDFVISERCKTDSGKEPLKGFGIPKVATVPII